MGCQKSGHQELNDAHSLNSVYCIQYKNVVHKVVNHGVAINCHKNGTFSKILGTGAKTPVATNFSDKAAISVSLWYHLLESKI